MIKISIAVFLALVMAAPVFAAENVTYERDIKPGS
jgi:hypothetical protein